MSIQLKTFAEGIFISAFMLLCCSSTLAQKKVTGKVLNANDQLPIAGASVQIKGGDVGTNTDENGNFSISARDPNAVLVISYVGYTSLETSLAGKSSLGNLLLSSTSSNLNEVVVTGYTSQRKKDITGSVAVVNVADLKTQPTGTTESLLQGQAAGVTIVNSGAPGGPSNIRVRGITSVGSTEPLVIIDGAYGSLHDLNVNDVQSIQVLKDAGAAAIYGVRGSNGVVIVTTKRGRSGKARIEYDGYYGTQQPLKGNVWNLTNPQEAAEAIWQTYENLGLQPVHKQYGNGPEPVIPDYITPTGAKEGDPNTDPSTYALYTNQITRANKAGTDWFHEIFKPAPIQSHNISVSGGGEKSTYLFSLNYFNQQGTLLNTYLKRYSARLNTSFTLKDKIRVGENIYVYYKQNPKYLDLPGVNNASSLNAAFRMPGIVPVYDIRGNFAGGGSQSLGNAPNPVAIMERTKDYTGTEWQINGNVFAEVDLLRDLTVRTSFGGTLNSYFNNFFTYTAYENAENSTNPNGYIENYGYTQDWNWTSTLKYTKSFASTHNLIVLLGTEAIENNGRAIGASRGSYFITDFTNLTVDPNLWTLNAGQASTQTNQNIISNNGVQTPYSSSIYSIFGRLDYNYKEKYLLSATLRRDGSSVFNSEKRYGTFPSATLGWRISEESFMKQISWVDDLKIRGGWGVLGSISNISPTNAYTLYGRDPVLSYYDIGGSSTSSTPGNYSSQIGNPFTTWEEDIITNIGFDATLLENKFDLSLEWYKKSISGLLFQENLPFTAGGAAPPFVNSGNIENSGIDLALTYHGRVNDFSFDVTGTVTSYNNKVKSLPPGINYIDYSVSRLQPGQAVGAFFGYRVLGLFQSDDDVAKSPAQDAAAPGRFKYADMNGDNKIDANDRSHFGNPNPDFTAGLNVSARYKNFDLFLFMYASVGNDVVNNVRASTDFPQSFDVAISKDALYNSWRPDRTNAKVPILERTGNFSNGSGAFNSYFLEKGSYLRAKTLSIGYTIPVDKLARAGLDRLRIYVQAANLFTITKYTGLDPELPGSNTSSVNFGIDGGVYPANQKTFTFGVNLAF